MNFLGAAAVLVAGTGVWASDAGQLPKRVVTVCLKPDSNVSILHLDRGRGIAAQIFKQAGIRLEWKTDERSCVSTDIAVALSSLTPEDRYPDVLAYAMPYGRGNIVLFYDRVLNAVRTDAVPRLLGYVLAHEIVHILQGLNHHSARGIMKPHWGYGDYADMRRGLLNFTEEDILLIHNGLDRWSRVAPAE
jgi:hypothetical protein